MILSVLTALPDPGDAREAARRELLDRQYDEARPPWTQRAIMWVLGKLGEALDAASGIPGGRLGVLFIVLLVAGLTALVIVRLRPTVRVAQSAELFEGGQVRTAAEHRAEADAAAARGDYAVAVRERLRAAVRSLEEAGVLDPRPGRTAQEVSTEAAAAVPALGAPLRRGAVAFERIWYGGQPADSSAYALLVAVDDEVERTALVSR